MPDREEMIRQFVEVNDFREKLGTAIEAIAKTQPAAALIVWETNEGYFMTSVPFSRALARGLLGAAMDVLNREDEDDVDDSDDVSDDDME